MYLAKVIGTVVSTSKDERLIGFKLLLARRIDEQGEQTGSPEICVDTVGRVPAKWSSSPKAPVPAMRSTARTARWTPPSSASSTP